MPKTSSSSPATGAQRAPLNQPGVRLAFPAIERVRTLALLEFARQHVAAHPVACGQVVKIAHASGSQSV